MRHERLRPAPVEARLARALVATGRVAGIAVDVAEHRSRPWASATFVGAQHDVALIAPRSSDLGAWVAALPDAELSLPDHVVASLVVERIEDDGATVVLTLAILTIEER